MQSYYDINVTFHGQHLFATHPRSAKSKEEAERIFNAIKAKFPESEGYNVSCTHWAGAGSNVSF